MSIPKRKTPPPSTDVSVPKPRSEHVEDLVDESNEESFPASDPPAVHTKRDPVKIDPEPDSDADSGTAPKHGSDDRQKRSS